MALHCTACGVKLFGEEVATGLCEYCRDMTPEAREQAARQARQARQAREERATPARRAGGLRPEWQSFRTGLQLLWGSLALQLLLQLVTGGLLLMVLFQGGSHVLATGQLPRTILGGVQCLL